MKEEWRRTWRAWRTTVWWMDKGGYRLDTFRMIVSHINRDLWEACMRLHYGNDCLMMPV